MSGGGRAGGAKKNTRTKIASVVSRFVWFPLNPLRGEWRVSLFPANEYKCPRTRMVPSKINRKTP